MHQLGHVNCQSPCIHRVKTYQGHVASSNRKMLLRMNTQWLWCLRSNKHVVRYPSSPYVAFLWNNNGHQFSVRTQNSSMEKKQVKIQNKYRTHLDRSSSLVWRLSLPAMPGRNTGLVPNSLNRSTIWHNGFQNEAHHHDQYPTPNNCTRPKTISPSAIDKSSTICWHRDHFATAWVWMWAHNK